MGEEPESQEPVGGMPESRPAAPAADPVSLPVRRSPYVVAPLGPADAYSAPEPQGNGSSLNLLHIVRRQWKVVVLIACLLAPPTLACIWLTMKPTYTATAHIEVAPTIKSAVREEEKVTPFYDSYLNTQASLIQSSRVLNAALAAAALRVPSLKSETDIELLRACLQVERVPQTHLLEVGVTRRDRESAIALAQAVVESYKAIMVDGDTKEARDRLTNLENQKKTLKELLDRREKELIDLTDDTGASADSSFDIEREGMVKAGQATMEAWQKAKLEVAELKDELEDLLHGATTTAPTLENLQRLDREVEESPKVVFLKARLADVQSRLAGFLAAKFTDENPEVVEMRKQEKLLTEDLKKAREAARIEARQKAAERWQVERDVRIAELQLKVRDAERRQARLENQVRENEAERKKKLQPGVKIKNLMEEIESIKRQLDGLNADITRAEMEQDRPGRVKIQSEAGVRIGGYKDKRMKMSVAAVVGILVLAAGVALVRDRADQSLYLPQDVATDLGLPVLGAVPCLSELKEGRVTQAHFIESYRAIRACLATAGGNGAPPKSLLVTSGQAGEGKTSLAISLAATLAEAGGRVLLVDGDTWAPSIGRFFNLGPDNGLKSVLRGEQPIVGQVVPSRLAGVDILSAGLTGDRTASWLNNRTAARLLREALTVYDHVVVDSPPALGAADALVWANVVDGVVLSSLAGSSDRGTMRFACDRLRSVGARVLGAVVGNVSMKENRYSYSFSSDRCGGGQRDSRGARAADWQPVVEMPDRHEA